MLAQRLDTGVIGIEVRLGFHPVRDVAEVAFLHLPSEGGRTVVDQTIGHRNVGESASTRSPATVTATDSWTETSQRR